MRSIAAALALTLAVLVTGCANRPPEDMLAAVAELGALDGVQSASVVKHESDFREIVVVLEPDATPAQAGGAAERFVEVTRGADETWLVVLPGTADADGPTVVAGGSVAAPAAKPDVEPDPRRFGITTVVEDADLAGAAAAVWWQALARLGTAQGRVFAGSDGIRFALDVRLDRLSSSESSETLAGAADVVVRLLEGSGIPLAALSWEVRGDGSWSALGVLPDEATRAAVEEAVAAAGDGRVEPTVGFEEDSTTLSLEVPNVAQWSAVEAVYAGPLAAMAVLAERGIPYRLEVRSDNDLLAVYGADGCPEPGLDPDGRQPPPLASCPMVE